MFEEYQEKVLQDYKKKSEKKLLRQFERITPALLKREFVNILKERKEYDKDILTLRAFFGPDERGRGYERIIEDFPTPSFRALSNFFREEKKPDRINTELIAWLIDYEPRPYAERDAYAISSPKPKHVENQPDQSGQEVLIVDNKNIQEEEKPKQDQNRDLGEDKVPLIPKKYYKTIGAFVAAFVAIIIAYFSFSNNKKCMYWTGDRYVAIDCSARIPNTIILDLDVRKIAHFRRITRPDTLTKKDIGRVWRSKRSGKVSFFTDSGSNPVDTNLRLLPLTTYMLDKWGNISK